MTLTERAKQAAREMGNADCPTCDFFPGGDGPCENCIADAIEKVARDFAERALTHRRLAHCWKHGQIPVQDCLVCSNGIAAAIAEAENGYRWSIVR